MPSTGYEVYGITECRPPTWPNLTVSEEVKLICSLTQIRSKIYFFSPYNTLPPNFIDIGLDRFSHTLLPYTNWFILTFWPFLWEPTLWVISINHVVGAKTVCRYLFFSFSFYFILYSAPVTIFWRLHAHCTFLLG